MVIVYIIIGFIIGFIGHYLFDTIRKADKINPNHYVGQGGKQCIDYMIDQYGAEHTYWFCKLNAFKYRFRAGNKVGESSKTDYAKADWYDNYAIKLEKNIKL